jgi:hypothetical protein
MEEAEALEAYELVRQRVKWQNTGVGIRDEIVARHAQQALCLEAKLDLEWSSMLPGSIARENHWRAVIKILEDQVQKEDEDSNDALQTTRGILKTESGLPNLGRKVPPSPTRHVTNLNTRRRYSQKGPRLDNARRPKSSLSEF